jgi:hypothetical protein
VGLFAIPPLGANVWVEFEQGDADKPVWVGGFWSAGETPPPAAPDRKMLRTQSSAIVMDDSPGGGVSIDSSSIKVNGNASFSRSGVVAIPPGATSATVEGIDLTPESFVLATLQANVPGTFVRGAVTDPEARAITVYLNRPAGRGARAAWFVAG